MSRVYDYLQQCKAKLQTIPTFQSVAIGLERGIGSKDAPFARIVPISHEPDGVGATLRFQVVYGFDTKNRDYEQLHEQYFATEEAIIEAMRRTGALWERTVTDEDAVQNLKTAVILFVASGVAAQC